MSEAELIQVGHSPDPDDAFMFYGIQAGKVNTFGYKVDHVVEDIESLNQRAMKGELEVTAISLHCYAHVGRNQKPQLKQSLLNQLTQHLTLPFRKCRRRTSPTSLSSRHSWVFPRMLFPVPGTD